jgi:hypothetical protein
MSVIATPTIAGAQQRGGVLQIAHRDSPASMSPEGSDNLDCRADDGGVQ